MNQYELKEKTIILRVKKSPLIIRIFMFFFAFTSIILPLLGIIFTMLNGGRFHIGFLFGLIFFGLIGFYLLRVSLWNTYGKESIILNETSIEFEADYGWFKDGKKSINTKDYQFSINQIGYEEDKTGVLVIGENTDVIESVVKMPIIQIEELITKIKSEFNTVKM